MKKRDVVRRIICMMLALTLLFAALPMNVLAAEVGATANNLEDPDINSTNTGNSNTSTDGGVDTPSEPNKYPTSSGNLPEDQNNPNDELIGDIITTEDGYRIQMNGDGESYSIIEYFGVSKNVVIPSSYRGKPITKILDSAFYGNKTAQKITIPESVIFIGEYTFYNLSESYVYNDDGQGKYIGSINNPYYYFVAPKDKNATEITLHDDTAIVGSYAFAECENMKTVTIGNNVISMGYAVFGKDSKVENITIPFIGENGKTEYNAHFGYIFGARTTGGNISYVPLTLKSVTINGGSYIEQNAMYGVDMIENLTLPFLGASADDTKTNYLSYIFGGESYEDNIIPQTLANIGVLGGEIGYGAFYKCVQIEKIVLHNIEYIREYAFSGCTNLKQLELPNSIVNIETTAFYSCSELPYNQYDNALYLGNSENPYLVLVGLISSTDYISSCVIHSETRVIKDSAFANSDIYTFGVLNIPSSVRHIGEKAFYNCGFYYVNLPQNLQTIGASAFENCKYLQSVYIYKNVSQIGNRAFYGCTELSEVGFEEGSALESIEAYTFYQCKALNYLPVPEGVVSIEEYAFARYSYNSATVSFPSTLRYIGQKVFGNSDYASRVTIRYNGSENDWYQNVFRDTNNELYSTTVNFLIDNSEYAGFLFATNGDGTCDIRGYQGQVPDFLVIPEKSPIGEIVVGIGYEAFYNCSNITSVILPSTLTTIGQVAFGNCNNLKIIDIPDGVRTIEADAFAYCSSLESVGIPSGCVIESRAFYGCDNLIKEYGNALYVGSYENPYYVLVEATSTSITSCNIHSSTKVILSRAFKNCSSLAEIIIPQNIEYIGLGAFYNCTTLETITLPFIGSSRTIDDNTLLGYIFADSSWVGAIGSCTPSSLKKVVITDVETVGAYAFEDCKYITSIVLSSDVKSIGERAFSGCTSLNDITIPEGISRIETGTFGGCSSLAEIDIPSSVTYIGDQAFSGCLELRSIIIPSDVTHIGSFAFYGCDKIEEIVIPKNVKTIETQAFSDCANLKRVLFEEDSCIEYVDSSTFMLSELLEYNVYDEVNYLGSSENPYLVLVKSSAFERTACTIHPDTRLVLANAFNSHEELETIHIPKNVIIIGDSAFEYCYALNEISFETNSSLERIGYSAFRNCGAIVEITIPKSVKIIGSYAFNKCYNINAVYFESGSRLNAIEDYAFNSCYKLNSIVIPDCVDSIGVYAFAGCTGLAEITIGENCAAINDYAFSGCTELSNITLPNGITFIGSSIFNSCTNLVNIFYDGEETEWRHITKATDWDNGATNTTLTKLIKERALLFETSDDIKEFYISGYKGEDGQVEAPSQYSGRPVTIVYERAFDGNKLLTSISLPESILVIGKFAFRNCTNLEKIEFPKNLNTIERGILSGCTSIEELTIPFLGAIQEYEDDEFVGYYFGANDYSENILYVPNTLRSINVLHMEYISDYCFKDCVGLREFIIPDETVSVGIGIFEGCSSIETISIGKSLQTISDYGYGNPLFGLNKSSSMLKSYSVATDNEIYVADEYGILYRKMDIPYTAGTEIVRVEIIDVPAMANLAGYAIPDHIVSIAPYAFAYNATLRMIDLTYVRNISNNAFYQASNLVNVTLGTPIFTEFEREDDFNSAFDKALESMPDGMWEQVYSQYIGDSAFRGCHSLMKIDIDTDNIVGIGDYAFADCPNLKTIMLGKNIERLGLAVFSATTNGDSNIERFVVDEDNVHFKSIDGILYSVNLDNSLTLEIFPAMAVELDSYGEPMYNDDGTNVYKYTFELPYDVYVKAIQTYAFQGTKELITVKLNPAADMIVGDYAFANSSVQNVEIGKNVVSLGLIRGDSEYSVFADANDLTYIEVALDNEYYSSDEGVLFDKNKTTLIKYPAAKIEDDNIYDIPNGVRTIAAMAFKNNQNIQRVNVRSYVETVGFEAFYACGNLSFVNFENVYAPYSIMENAFTTQVEIENGSVNSPKATIVYSLGYYYDGANGEIGWVNYADEYTLKDEKDGTVVEPSPEADRNNFYAIVVIGTDGTQLGDMLVSLTDPFGKTEAVRTGRGTEGEGIAMFYDLAGVEGLGFALNFTQPYVIKVADPHNVYYTYESTAVYLDEEMRITYITLERKPCDVSFNVNGGDGSIDTIYDVEVDVGKYEISNQNVSRAGYTLAGWATSADGVVEYTDYFSTSKYKAHYVLYAVWKPNTNTINFDANTGVGGMSDITVKTDATVVLPENQFTLTGFNFIGWSLEKNGKVDYTDASEFTSGPNSNYTLYACWTENENTIVFNAGGGTGEMESESVKTYYAFTIPENTFVRDGYTFDHWVDESGAVCENGKYQTNANPVQVLTAVWKANENTIGFDANGGTGDMASVTGTTDSTIILPPGTFMRMGYMLIGWSETPNGSLEYDNAGEYKVNAKPTQTLYAVWAKLPDTYGVSCKGQDINSQDAKVNIAEYYYKDGKLTDDETIEISAIVYDNGMGYEVVDYNNNILDQRTGIYQNGHKISTISKTEKHNGYVILFFNVKVSDIIPDCDLEFKTIYQDVTQSEYLAKRSVNTKSEAITSTVLNIYAFDFTVNTAEISKNLANIDIDLTDDTGNFVTDLIGVAIEKIPIKNMKYSVKCEIKGDTVTASLSVDDYVSFVDTETLGFNVVPTGSVVFQYNPITKEADIVSCSIKIAVVLEVETPDETIWIWGWLPVDVGLKFEAEGGFVCNFQVDGLNFKWENLCFEVAGTAKPHMGLGTSDVSAGIYGTIGTMFALEIIPNFQVDRWTWSGSIGLYAKAWLVKCEMTLISGGGNIISPKQLRMLMTLSSYPDMYLVDNYSPIEANDLGNTFDFVIINNEIHRIGFIDASEQEGYDANNFVKLSISKWTEDGWTTPTILDDNGMNDASYTIYCDGNNAYAIITQQTRKMIETEMNDTYVSSRDLTLKVVNLSSGEVLDDLIDSRSGTICITQFSIIDGVPTLIWVENADNNIFGVSPENYIDSNGISHVFATTANSIWVSRFENGAWSEPIAIADNLSTVTDIAISSHGEVAYIIDTNGALTDSSDRVMYYGKLEGDIAAFNHISVGSVLSVEFGNEGLIYYYDLFAEDGEETDGLRVLTSNGNSSKEILPNNIPEDSKIVRDESGNIIAIFYFENKTWDGEDDKKYTGSALYAIFKENGVWGKAVEVSGYTPIADYYIYTYDVTFVPGSVNELMISVTTITTTGDESSFKSVDFVYLMRGELIVESYNVNYVDGTVDLTVRNGGATKSAVYVSIGNGYLLIDEELLSGESKTYTVSLNGNPDRKYIVAVDGDQIGDADWTREELDLNYSDIVPYAKQLLIGGKNVLLLAVKNTGNTVDNGVTIVRVGEHMADAIVSLEILNAISNLNLDNGESVIIEITNESGEKEKIWVGNNVVDAYGIAYHEILLSDLCTENIGIISIATIVTDNEKGVAVDNNFTHVSYNECVGSLEEGENVEYKPTIFENTLEFDQQNDDGVELNYTYGADDSVLEVYVDQIKVSNELYENTINGTRGTIILHADAFATLSNGIHTITLNFESGNTCEVELNVVSYYTVTVNDGNGNYTELTVKEGTIPMLPTVSKEADDRYTYVLNGWDVNGDKIPDNITAVIKDTVYTAVWKGIEREYEITWVMLSKDGKSVSVTEKYHYEDIPQYDGTVFVPEGMQFVSWDMEIDKVTQNCTYTAQYKQERQVGDINGDGVINTRDVAMLRQYVVGKIELSDEVLIYCNIYNDYNDDGSVKINTRDVALLQQIIVGTNN